MTSATNRALHRVLSATNRALHRVLSATNRVLLRVLSIQHFNFQSRPTRSRPLRSSVVSSMRCVEAKRRLRTCHVVIDCAVFVVLIENFTVISHEKTH